MEVKAKTIIERFGFLDYDRKKFSHDEIQIWAYRNFRGIVKNVFPLIHIDQTKPLDLKLEYPVASNNYIIGFVDIFCKEYNIGVEVKTEIPVLGDLIRQIQFYRKYVTGSWIIVSPDDRSSSILKEQGIYFFKYCHPSSKDQLRLF
jgi:hypothetical protein